jgi:hypothetical protein
MLERLTPRALHRWVAYFAIKHEQEYGPETQSLD